MIKEYWKSADQVKGILRGLCLGNRELADLLCVSESTVKRWKRKGVPWNAVGDQTLLHKLLVLQENRPDQLGVLCDELCTLTDIRDLPNCQEWPGWRERALAISAIIGKPVDFNESMFHELAAYSGRSAVLTTKGEISWLAAHKIWQKDPNSTSDLMSDCITVEQTFINPVTGSIDDVETRNVEFQVNIEAGPWCDLEALGIPEPENGWNSANRWGHSHDHALDVSAVSYKIALLKLAAKVRQFYNDDGTRKED
jgi:hypothetical protein